MNGFFDLIFSSVNLPLTILVALLILYWIVTMVSGLDADLDIDLDIDADLDVGLEGGNVNFEDFSNAEVDKEDLLGKRQRPLKWWQVFLIYFNFVGLPFMFTFSTLIFSWWIITLLATSITNSYGNWFGANLFFAAIIPALIFTKIFTTPFKSFFKKLNKDGDVAVDYVGQIGTSLSSISADKLGRAELVIDGNPLNVYIKSLDGSEIKYQQTILLIKESADKNFYYAKTYNN